MKGLRSLVTGNITGWNRNIWKTGRVEVIDINDKPTPVDILEDIRKTTGLNVKDGAPAEAAPAPAPDPMFRTVVESETNSTGDDSLATEADLDLDDIDVDNL